MKKRNGKKNRRNERGVITVLVTLILIPTVFFTGFLVDLTRIKMFTNQAVMSADTYGEAILTDYDNLLREMYGLFGVSQDAPHAAVKRDAYIGNFNEDILATFDLSQTTRWGYNFWNGTIFDKWAGVGDPRNGKVIPFRTVDAKLDYEFMENATLMDQTVFGTQVGDFMKIRFVQVVGEDSETLVQAIDKINNMEGDAKVIKSKREYDEQAGKALKALQAYYEKLKDYEKYALKVREFHDDCHNHTRPLLESAQEEYDWEQEKRAEFEQKQKEREAAAANGEEVEDDGESLEDLEAEFRERRQNMKPGMDSTRDDYSSNIDYFDETLRPDYEDFIDDLDDKCKDLKKELEKLKEARNKVSDTLAANETSDDLEAGVNEELAKFDELMSEEHANPQNYQDIVDHLRENINSMAEMSEKSRDVCDNDMTNFINEFVDTLDPPGSLPDESFPMSLWTRLDDHAMDKSLYDKMHEFFDNKDDGSSKKKEEQAKEVKEECEKEISEDEETEAKDIPASYAINVSNSTILGRVAGGMDGLLDFAITFQTLKDTGNLMLNKFLMALYDFGMFSCRTTNVKGDALTGSTEKAPTVEKTLTKHELSEDLNYVYQAELEYILGGHNSSKDNLNDTRNRILAFEAVLNYTASYSVSEVNDAINAARDAAAAINPIAGIAVGAALRLGFTAAETAGDWKVLKSGNKVKIGKRATADCTGLQLIGSLIGVSSTDTYQPTDGLQLSYRDFVQIMILFLTSYGNVVGRTQTLVTVNMNYLEFASAGGDVPAEPNFKLEEAHTAVEASCSVKSPWWMMPLGFAARTTPEHAGELASFADNTYTYSVIRSY